MSRAEDQYPKINLLLQEVNKALFRSDGKLSYTETLEAIEKLAQEVVDTDTDENVWSLGETGPASLDSVIVGAYWFLTDYHGGQDSLEYKVLSRLGEIYSPGMEDGPMEDSSEQDVYEALEYKKL